MKGEIKQEDGEVWVGSYNITESMEKMFDEIECLLIMKWSGSVTQTDLTAIEMHEKITDDNRSKFNDLKNKYLYGMIQSKGSLQVKE